MCKIIFSHGSVHQFEANAITAAFLHFVYDLAFLKCSDRYTI